MKRRKSPFLAEFACTLTLPKHLSCSAFHQLYALTSVKTFHISNETLRVAMLATPRARRSKCKWRFNFRADSVCNNHLENIYFSANNIVIKGKWNEYSYFAPSFIPSFVRASHLTVLFAIFFSIMTMNWLYIGIFT